MHGRHLTVNGKHGRAVTWQGAHLSGSHVIKNSNKYPRLYTRFGVGLLNCVGMVGPAGRSCSVPRGVTSFTVLIWVLTLSFQSALSPLSLTGSFSACFTPVCIADHSQEQRARTADILS